MFNSPLTVGGGDSCSDLASSVDDRKKVSRTNLGEKRKPWMSLMQKQAFNPRGASSKSVSRKSSRTPTKIDLAPREIDSPSCQTIVGPRQIKKSFSKDGPVSPVPFRRTRKGQKAPGVVDQDFNMKDLHEKSGKSIGFEKFSYPEILT